ncbi:MAG: WbqC family protein [Crocinitomicaceae bacterium]|nr:WbqC family protein [Crocinitomicaceae bacterium]
MHIFPTAYFAPIAYYHAYVHAKEPVIEAKEHFVKQTIRTRCELLGPNGKQLLSVPVERINGNKTTVEDLRIVEDGWRKIHWKTIETAYSSSAYFDYYGMEVKELLESDHIRLIDLNDAVHQRVLSWLDIEIPTIYTTTYHLQPETDDRMTSFDTESGDVHAPYHQVFRQKEMCLLNLSVLDLIFNEGPMARKWII